MSTPPSHPVIVSTIKASDKLKWKPYPVLPLSGISKVISVLDQPEVRKLRVSVVSI